MFVSLQQLELGSVRFNVDVPVGDIDFDKKTRQASVLHAKGEAQLLNGSLGEIRMVGDLQMLAEGSCDRCTEAAVYSIDNHFDLVYLPSADANFGGENEIDEAGVEVGYYDGNGIELNDVLREVVLLALPMQLVCEESCKGICPTCGQNRNQTDCRCEPALADDRWSKLKLLKTELGSLN